jgi:hypothetical protein
VSPRDKQRIVQQHLKSSSPHVQTGENAGAAAFALKASATLCRQSCRRIAEAHAAKGGSARPRPRSEHVSGRSRVRGRAATAGLSSLLALHESFRYT